MTEALRGILMAPPPPDGSRETTAMALHAARPAAARVLRLLVQSSPAAARAARNQGVVMGTHRCVLCHLSKHSALLTS